MTSFENRLKNVDWGKFSGPEYYDPAEVVNALTALYMLSSPDTESLVYNRVLFSIGNNHRGTYYPAILMALGFLQEISKMRVNKYASTLAQIILIDIETFSPEVEGYTDQTASQIEDFVRKQNDTTGFESPDWMFKKSKRKRKFWI